MSIHNTDYSLVQYTDDINALSNVTQLHWQYIAEIRAQAILRQVQQIEQVYESLLADQQEFIKIAQDFHGADKYDYSRVDYKGPMSKIKIQCNKCMIVSEQTSGDHLIDSGCRGCGDYIKGSFE